MTTVSTWTHCWPNTPDGSGSPAHIQGMTVIQFRQRAGAPAGVGGQFKATDRATVDIPLSEGFGALTPDDIAQLDADAKALASWDEYQDDLASEAAEVSAMADARMIADRNLGRVCEPELNDEWIAYVVQGSELVDPERWHEAVIQARASLATPYLGIVSPGLHYAVDYAGGDSVSAKTEDNGATTYTRQVGGQTVTFTTPVYQTVDENGRPWSDGQGYYRYSVGDRSVRGFRKASDVAKLIRADIKAAVAVGWLPDNLTFSVTTDSYSGGQSIDITAKGWSDEDRTAPEHVLAADRGWGRRGTERTAVVELEKRLGAMRNRYARNCSMGEIDFFQNDYLGSTTIQSDGDAAWEAQEKAARASRASRS